jgi:hypothetical protein
MNNDLLATILQHIRSVVYMLQLALLSAELRKTMLELNMTTSAGTTLPGKSE